MGATRAFGALAKGGEALGIRLQAFPLTLILRDLGILCPLDYALYGIL